MHADTLRTGLVAGAVFLFMLALNHLMPVHRDDYDYSMVWKTGAHLASFSDVCASGVQHYLLHGGRTVTVFCLQLFLWLGKTAFDIANALMFLVLVVLATMHARRALDFWKHPRLLAAAALLLWLALPHFGEVAVWKSGSTVYLWSAVPAFLFLLPYNLALRALSEGRQAQQAQAVLPMLLLGVLGGWSIENLAVTVVVTAFGASLYVRRRYGTCPAWMIAGALGALLGLVGLVAAPGNYVRYDAQGAGKGILAHIGNQFAGQGEMLLYLLPVLLLIRTAWRLYRQLSAGQPIERHGSLLLYAGKKYVVGFSTDGIRIGTVTLVALISLLTLSYFTGGWVAGSIRDAIIGSVLTPLGFTKPKTIHLFTNLMNGFEEMAIYWFTVLLFYVRIKQKLGLTAAAVRAAAECVPARDVLRRHPAARYATFLMALGICNNLVMLAAPTFPGRATFSSAAMFVTAALALLSDAPIRSALLPRAGSVLCACACLLFAYTGTAALLITQEMGAADAARIARIEEIRARGETVVHFPRIERTNRALRHVYYEDWDNTVTKEGAMEYFGLTDVVVDGK